MQEELTPQADKRPGKENYSSFEEQGRAILFGREKTPNLRAAPFQTASDHHGREGVAAPPANFTTLLHALLVLAIEDWAIAARPTSYATVRNGANHSPGASATIRPKPVAYWLRHATCGPGLRDPCFPTAVPETLTAPVG